MTRPVARMLIEQVPCPKCAAEPGQQCRTPGGNPARYPHAERRSAAVRAGRYTP